MEGQTVAKRRRAKRKRDPEYVRAMSAASYQARPEYHRDASRRSNEKIKTRVISSYGGKCSCGVVDCDLLTIDHVGGGGNSHRRKMGSSFGNMWRVALREGCPAKYRLLCRNCNMRDHLERLRTVPPSTLAAAKERDRKANYKRLAFSAYGGPVCSDCGGGEGDYDVLSLDHIEPVGGGRKRACGWHLYKQLSDAGWPAGYRVLCLNCNWKRHMTA